MALTRVHNVKTFRACLAKNTLNWRDWRARQRKVVAHLVDVATFTAEIGLHIDNQDDRVIGSKVAVVGPGVRVCVNVTIHCDSTQ